VDNSRPIRFFIQEEGPTVSSPKSAMSYFRNKDSNLCPITLSLVDANDRALSSSL
jgi:hypothetical protein